MTIALGIDTGGTFTDAALIEQQTGRVLASAKSLTTHDDLSRGIVKAISAVLDDLRHADSPEDMGDISLVGLSTTLATNAIVEGQGCPVCLLLVAEVAVKGICQPHGWMQFEGNGGRVKV